MRLAHAKSAITAILLAFVVCSLAYAAVQELRGAPGATAAEAPDRAIPPGDSGLDALKGGKGKTQSTVYYATYYHGNVRCPTCMKIETYSQECIETRFAKEIKAGKVAWRTVNYDEKGNEHFYKDYGLTAQSLIVSEVKGNKELRWKNLEKVWDLTYDKDKFIQYFEDEFRAFMSAKAEKPAEAAGVAPAGATAGELQPSATAGASAGETKVIAYYFHATARCPSCLKIEAYSKEAIENAFADELKSGKLEWQVVNVEEPQNRHFVGDYSLTTKSLVLVRLQGGKPVAWEICDAVWDYLGDKKAFESYVVNEVAALLGAA